MNLAKTSLTSNCRISKIQISKIQIVKPISSISQLFLLLSISQRTPSQVFKRKNKKKQMFVLFLNLRTLLWLPSYYLH